MTSRKKDKSKVAVLGTTSNTPGPWTVVGRLGYGYLIGPNVAVAYGGVGSGHADDGEANARLIAAAPDLLSAAREVMEALEQYGASIVPHLLDDDMNAGQRLRNAIANAVGAV